MEWGGEQYKTYKEFGICSPIALHIMRFSCLQEKNCPLQHIQFESIVL